MSTEHINTDLGDAIRAQVHSEPGRTLESESLRLELSKNQLHRWATGVEPGPESYDLLMKYLGVSLAELGGLIAAAQLRRHRRTRR